MSFEFLKDIISRNVCIIQYVSYCIYHNVCILHVLNMYVCIKKYVYRNPVYVKVFWERVTVWNKPDIIPSTGYSLNPGWYTETDFWKVILSDYKTVSSLSSFLWDTEFVSLMIFRSHCGRHKWAHFVSAVLLVPHM